MLTSEFVERVSADLVNLGEIGGPDVADVVNRLVRALDPVLKVRFLEAIDELVAECASTGGPAIGVSIQGTRVRLRANDDAEVSQPPSTGELTSRFALRVTEAMKRDVERRAVDEGISINSWIVRAIDRALTPMKGPPNLPGKGPRRLSGTGRA